MFCERCGGGTTRVDEEGLIRKCNKCEQVYFYDIDHEKWFLKSIPSVCLIELDENGDSILPDFSLPDCPHQGEGNINEGTICRLSEHECYWMKSSYLDCQCLLRAGLCSEGWV